MKPMSRRRLARSRHRALTRPTKSGKQYPVLFGESGTKILLYLALNRGATGPEIKAALELRSGAFHRGIDRLRRLRVVIGRYWYQIPTNLRNEKELVLFLRDLGEAYGLTGKRGSYGPRNTVARADRTFIATPPEIFGNRNRTLVLLALAVLVESYALELHKTLRIGESRVSATLEQLLVEGVLRTRDVGRLRCYSFDPTFPGAEWLLTYLRLEAKAIPTIVMAANAALARRIEVERVGRRSQRNAFAELAKSSAGNSVKGMERFWMPRKRWKRLNGHWSGSHFKKSRRGLKLRLTPEEHAAFSRLVRGGDRAKRGRIHVWARALEQHLEKHDRVRTPDLYHWLYGRVCAKRSAPMLRSDASKIVIAGVRANDPELPAPGDWVRMLDEVVPNITRHRGRELSRFRKQEASLR